MEPGEGKVIGFKLEEIIWMCAYLKKSGILRLTSPDGTGYIGFAEGSLIEIICPNTPQLGELLIKHNYLTSETLKPVLEEQARSKDRRFLGELLINKGLVNQQIITKNLEIQTFLALKKFFEWKYILYEFTPTIKKPDGHIVISFKGIEPFEILQKVMGSEEKYK